MADNFSTTYTDSGFKLIYDPIPDSKSFALGFAVDTGSRDDFKDKAGLSHFVEHAVFRRSKNLTSKQISQKFESLGAYINAFTTKEFTCYYVRALNEHLESVYALLAEVVYFPEFTEKDFNKEKKIIKEEITSYEDDPEELIFDYAEKYLFQGNSMEFPIIGSIESLKNITFEDIKSYHKQNYTLENSLISYCGSHSFNFVNILSEKYLSKVEKNLQEEFTRETPNNYKSFKKNYKKDFQQSHIVFCKTLPGMKSESRYDIAAVNVILGDGMSSRLYQSIREKHSLVYSIYSTLQLYSDCGNVIIYAGSENKNLSRISELITTELENLILKKLKPSEISRAKEQLKSSTIMAMENISDRMQANIKSELSFGRYESIEESVELINQITPESISISLKNFFDNDAWSEISFISDN